MSKLFSMLMAGIVSLFTGLFATTPTIEAPAPTPPVTIHATPSAIPTTQLITPASLPSKKAFTACYGKSENTYCSFQSDTETRIVGTCLGQSNGSFACIPK